MDLAMWKSPFWVRNTILNNVMKPVFEGLKVVELATVLAGPAVGLFFAELGAEVIKVENKNTGGDVTRSWKLPGEDARAVQSAYYAAVNWGKTAWFCDLLDEGDRLRVLEAIAAADIVISNFRPDVARKLGMDYESLSRCHTRLIYGEITGFGKDNPQPAFDVVLQAEAGFLFMNGESDGEPVKMPVALIDLLAAHQLKEGLLVALLDRERNGKGAFVTVSLFDSAIASLANQATNWLIAGHIPQRMGSLHPNIAPYGDIFYTSDHKALVMAVGSDRQFAALCDCLGRAELAADARFSLNADRLRNREALCKGLASAIAGFERDQLLEMLHKAGVPCGSIRNMQEVFEMPAAQALLLESFTPEGHRELRPRTVVFRLE
jgi:crotonobetainyl-CoA:carnitine CoA-transferase CaiB-like acyl-CoA transferase